MSLLQFFYMQGKSIKDACAVSCSSVSNALSHPSKFMGLSADERSIYIYTYIETDIS